MNQITFNQELIDDIYSTNVQEELHTIKDGRKARNHPFGHHPH